MRILIAGGSGQVGYELQRSLSLYGEIDAPEREKLNLENLDAVTKYLEQTKPDLIVNAAAWTAVDKAEEEQDKCYLLNAALPELLASYAAQQGIWLIHFSSDYVYPGDGHKPWTEESPTQPLSVYGKTKLEGDQKVAASGAQYLIFRTSWVYSARGNNFMKTMLRLATERDSLSIVADQWGAPTPARLIADVTAAAVAKIRSKLAPNAGVYHLAPKGETCWHGFAAEIFRLAENEGVQLQLTSASGIATAEYPTPAQRPLNSRLSLEKIQQEYGIQLPEWQPQLLLTIKEYLSFFKRGN